MRLIRRSESGPLSITDDLLDVEIPPYAILSHTWLKKQNGIEQEILLRDVRYYSEQRISQKPGYKKVRFCADQAKLDGYDYCWIDTCCINKQSERELGEAIRSMFRWYRRASRCYVYLADVDPSEERYASGAWLDDFRDSVWFTRGWTLQELLAPRDVQFYSASGKRLGTKFELRREISNITKIPIAALIGNDLRGFRVAERLSWAEDRETTLVEDQAYSLLGIFGINLPLLYGEREDAMRRLKHEIITREQALLTIDATADTNSKPGHKHNYRQVHVTILFWQMDDVHDRVRKLTEVLRSMYHYKVQHISLPYHETIEGCWPWLSGSVIDERDLQIMHYIGSTSRSREVRTRGDLKLDDIFSGDLIACPNAEHSFNHIYPYENGRDATKWPDRFAPQWFSNLYLFPRLDCDAFLILDCYIPTLENSDAIVGPFSYFPDGDSGRLSILLASYNSDQRLVGQLSDVLSFALEQLVRSKNHQGQQDIATIATLRDEVYNRSREELVLHWLGEQSMYISPL